MPPRKKKGTAPEPTIVAVVDVKGRSAAEQEQLAADLGMTDLPRPEPMPSPKVENPGALFLPDAKPEWNDLTPEQRAIVADAIISGADPEEALAPAITLAGYDPISLNGCPEDGTIYDDTPDGSVPCPRCGVASKLLPKLYADPRYDTDQEAALVAEVAAESAILAAHGGRPFSEWTEQEKLDYIRATYPPITPEEAAAESARIFAETGVLNGAYTPETKPCPTLGCALPSDHPADEHCTADGLRFGAALAWGPEDPPIRCATFSTDPEVIAAREAIAGVRAELVPLGNALRNARMAAGVTMGDVARVLGVSAVWVSDVERGRALPSAGWLSAYVGAIGAASEPLFALWSEAVQVQGVDFTQPEGVTEGHTVRIEYVDAVGNPTAPDFGGPPGPIDTTIDRITEPVLVMSPANTDRFNTLMGAAMAVPERFEPTKPPTPTYSVVGGWRHEITDIEPGQPLGDDWFRWPPSEPEPANPPADYLFVLTPDGKIIASGLAVGGQAVRFSEATPEQQAILRDGVRRAEWNEGGVTVYAEPHPASEPAPTPKPLRWTRTDTASLTEGASVTFVRAGVWAVHVDGRDCGTVSSRERGELAVEVRRG